MVKDWILAIDGSRRDDPLVILASTDGEVTWSAPSPLPSPVLVGEVKAALNLYRDRIGSVVAVRGPGSYIGVRGGLAGALGAAQSLACPVALVGSLEVVAAQIDPTPMPLLALADAGRGGSFGQEMTPEMGSGARGRWRPRGSAWLLGRESPWPDAWHELRLVVGELGEGRQLPEGTNSISPSRSRQMALAWVVSAGLVPISGYDQVTADYAEPVGAR
ncbi:MAG: hypothetical protein WCB86_03355 [Candidatus Dormiibacterota bacterium]